MVKRLLTPIYKIKNIFFSIVSLKKINNAKIRIKAS